MTFSRETLAALHKAAGGDLNKLSPEDRLAAVRSVFGEATTEDQWRAWVSRYRALEVRGRKLAEFVVAYGLPPGRLDSDDITALALAAPYATALRVRVAAESATVAAGGVGSLTYYSTFTDGDSKEARRLQAEAISRSHL